MPYFGNMTSNAELEPNTREGGRELARAMGAVYQAVGELEERETARAREILSGAEVAANASLQAFRNAFETSRRQPLELSAGMIAEVASLGEALAWLERRGIPLDAVTDSDLLQVTIDGIFGFREALRRFHGDEPRPSFAAVNALVRAAIDVQLLALGVTALHEMSARAARPG